MTSYKSAQRGFAAIAAIFLVVVLAALGGFMLTFSTTQHVTSVQDIQGTRAYWAARAGLEWGMANVSRCDTFPLATPTSLPGAGATFDGGLTVSVDCTAQTYPQASASASVTIYRFNAVARSAGSVGSMGYIERSQSALMDK